MRLAATTGFENRWLDAEVARNFRLNCCTRFSRCAARAHVSFRASELTPELREAARRDTRWLRLLSTPAHRCACEPIHTHTLPRSFGNPAFLATNPSLMPPASRNVHYRLLTVSKITARGRSIRKKIIGHDWSLFPVRLSRGDRVLRPQRRLAFDRHLGGPPALLHQPAREHSRGVLLQPGIEQLSDLLAEISGMAQPGKFVALQRVAGGREQELPRRLGAVFQGALQGKREGNVTAIITIVNGTNLRTYCGNLWKLLPVTSDAQRAALAPLSHASHPIINASGRLLIEMEGRACSACPGDYEDPESTADSSIDGEEPPEPSDDAQRERESR